MWSGVGSSTHSQPEPGRQLREGIRGVDSSKIRLNRPPLNQGVARERGNTSERKFRYGGPSRCSGLAACFCVVFHSSSLLRHSPLPHFVNLCPTCDSSKKHEQNYIQVQTLPPYFQRDPFAMRLVQTTFSYARGPSLFSQGSLPCRPFGKSAGPNGCGRRDQTFPHRLRSGSPTWS